MTLGAAAGVGAKGGREAAIKRSPGGLTTKIPVTGDALGNPTSVHLTPGQAHDLQGGDTLMHDLQARTVMADQAYDVHERVIELWQRADKNIVIPPKSNRTTKRTYDADRYKACHLIENFFAQRKPYRVFASRYDNRAR